ncbi:MAG TPA: DUF5715 family protein [Longimicrobiaceae bacterium]|nr:DUF5715 family protein [Longimicrobiaceae bacterium]
MPRIVPALLTLLLGVSTPALAAGVASPSVTLHGSHASMIRQNEIAKENDYTFLRTPAQIRHFVDEGYLVPVKTHGDLVVSSGVSFPYARPELRTFLERLAPEYHDGCGERLVVTSLTRPLSEQPWNSSPLSVHPAGMASDLRVSTSARCREWLASALLGLERRGVLDVTREHHPSHFHVALFPDRYMAYAAPMIAADSAAAAERARLAAEKEPKREDAPAPALASMLVAPAEAAPAGKEHGVGFAQVVAVLLVFGVAAAVHVKRRRD